MVFIALFGALGIANMIEGRKSQKYMAQPMFGLMYILAAVGLILYKIKSH
jgi:hypothetical protein